MRSFGQATGKLRTPFPHLAGFLFCSKSREMGGRDEELPFRIELWDEGDRHVEEVIALALTSRLRVVHTMRR